MVRLMPFQGEFYDCPPTQGDALGYVLMAFQAVSMHGFHYFRNFSKQIKRGKAWINVEEIITLRLNQ